MNYIQLFKRQIILSRTIKNILFRSTFSTNENVRSLKNEKNLFKSYSVSNKIHRCFSSQLKYSFGYKDYGHRQYVRPAGQNFIEYFQMIFLLIGTYGIFYLTNKTEFEDRWTQNNQNDKVESNKFINFDDEQEKFNLKKFSNVKASTIENEISSNNISTNSFRDKRKISYENRLRSYSSPEKIFRYFATFKVYSDEHPEGIPMMTPEDFLRSISPGWKQPNKLELDKFIRLDLRINSTLNKEKENFNRSISIFERIGGDQCLLTYSDFIFLLTVLSTPRRYFKIAFQMFDLDGNGNLDFDEFSKLKHLIQEQTTVGQKHRDHSNSLNLIKDKSNLNKFLFGEKLDEILTLDKFLDFYDQLENEMLLLEFSRSNKSKSNEEKMSEVDFCSSLLSYSGLPEKRIRSMIRRIKRLYPINDKNISIGISFNDYVQFNKFVQNIHDIDIALTFYHIAGGSIDKQIFVHVAKTVHQIEFDSHLIDLVFNLFDENQDELLSYNEFIDVLKKKLERGLNKRKDTSFIRILSAFVECAKINYFDL